MKTGDTFFFPWVRKGLSKNIGEEEVFGEVRDNDKLAHLRAGLSIHTKYRAYAGNGDETGKERIDDKDVLLYGPGDVTSVRSSAVSLRHPAAGSKDFPCDYFPYVEFWEPDFPWRYTPARATADGRLRPWLALLVFRADQVALQKPDRQLPYVAFRGDEKEYKAVFYDIRELSRAAHAQGPSKNKPTLSRIIGLRGWKEGQEHREMVDLEPFTDYLACVVPTFESGRLRGLGVGLESLSDIVAQAPAWEAEYADQKAKQRGLEFPVYYSWEFRSGDQSFETLVKALTLGQSGKAGVTVDVAHMGEGFDYQTVSHDTSRMSIVMPAATRAPENSDSPVFPSPSGSTESILYDHLSELVSMNPVFLENAIQTGQSTEGMPTDGDDPVVVPPAYGARHVMATSLESEDRKGNTWLSRINLDVHYRAVAGLGRKVILENQEALMDRAWKQVEAVQALNQQLYRRLLSIGANTSLQGKVLGQYGQDNKYLASLMFYLGSMKDAKSKNGAGEEVSISSVLSGLDVPQAFATPSFHRLTDQVARVVEGLDTKSVLENILEHQTFRFPEQECLFSYSIAALRQYASDSFTAICRRVMDFYLLRYWKDGGYKYINGYVPIPSKGVAVEGNLPTGLWYDGLDVESIRQAYFSFNGWSRRTVPAGPILWYLAFSHYAYRTGRAPKDGGLPVVERLFFEGGYHRHPCYGYVNTAPEKSSPNLLGYPHGEYTSLFGKKPVTAINLDGGPLYVVDEDAVRELARPFFSAGITSSTSPIRLYYVLPFINAPTLSVDRPELSLTFGKYPSWQYKGDYTDYWEVRGLEVRRTGGLPEAGNQDRTGEYHGQAVDYLMRPSRIDIDLKDIPQENIQTFQSVEAYRDFLFARKDGLQLSYVRMWNEFNACVSELEGKFKIEKSVKEMIENAKKQIDRMIASSQSQATAPPTMKSTLAYEEALEVVENYYGEFYADTEMGEKLRKEYVDELLRTKYPILAYPIFPEPAYYYLKKVDDDLILPGAGDLPDDSVTVFTSNPAFVEAYLAGMNTEMGRELMWREYPTDQRGSYFRKFWDSESSVESIRQQTFFDIGPMHAWTGKLGSNMAEGKDALLIFAIKGRLMRLYPTTRIYLARAVSPKSGVLAYDPAATEENGGILQPVMETFLDDLLVIGFKISFVKAVGNPANGDFGYILTFQEDVQGLDFTCEDPEKDFDESLDPAQFADRLKNDPSVMGKHVSLFLK